MHPNKRVKAVEVCEAEALLMGGSYLKSPHAFILPELVFVCADTMEGLNYDQVVERGQEYLTVKSGNTRPTLAKIMFEIMVKRLSK